MIALLLDYLIKYQYEIYINDRLSQTEEPQVFRFLALALLSYYPTQQRLLEDSYKGQHH
jgi:hypothetical protein